MPPIRSHIFQPLALAGLCSFALLGGCSDDDATSRSVDGGVLDAATRTDAGAHSSDAAVARTDAGKSPAADAGQSPTTPERDAAVPTRCTGPACALVLGASKTLSVVDVPVYNMSLAASADGKLLSAAWNAYDAEKSEERPFVVTSKDAGSSFAAPVLLPDSARFAYPHVAALDSGKLLVAGVRYTVPESGTPDFRGFIDTYRSSDSGSSFTKHGHVADNDFAREQSALAASADGKVIVVAWVDSVSAMLMSGQQASPSGALWAAISRDGGASFAKPQVISSAPARAGGGRSLRPQLFVRGDRAGVLYLEQVAHPPLSPKVAAAFLKIADDAGQFGPAKRVDDDAHGILNGQPGVAVGPDGAIHVAWYAREPDHLGLWSAVSSDGATFGPPVQLYADFVGDQGLSVEVAVDGSGTEWVGFIDHDARLSVARTPKGGKSALVAGIQQTVTVTDEYLDLAPLPGDGIWLLWSGLGALPKGEDAGVPSTEIKLMRIAPAD